MIGAVNLMPSPRGVRAILGAVIQFVREVKRVISVQHGSTHKRIAVIYSPYDSITASVGGYGVVPRLVIGNADGAWEANDIAPPLPTLNILTGPGAAPT